MPRIRLYRAEDWEAYLALDVETGLASLQTGSADDRERFAARWPDILRERFGWTENGPAPDKGVLLVLVSDDDDYAGHLWLSEQQDLFTGKPKLWVTTVAVKATYRGRGWGRLLVKHAIEEARRRGLSSLGLGVDERNEGALTLYASLGFTVTRRTMELQLL